MSQGSAGSSGSLAAGLYIAAGISAMDGQQVSLQVDSAGNLKTTGSGSGGNTNVNLADVGGTAVNATAAAAGGVPIADKNGNLINFSQSVEPTGSPFTITNGQTGTIGTVNVTGYTGAIVFVTSGFSGNLSIQIAPDDALTYQSVPVRSIPDGPIFNSITGAGYYFVAFDGQSLKLNSTSNTTGATVTVLLLASNNAPFMADIACRSAWPTLGVTSVQTQKVADLNHRLIVIPYAMPEKQYFYAAPTGGITTATTTTLKTAISAEKLYISAISAQNVHATTDVELLLKVGTTLVWSWTVKALGVSSINQTLPDPVGSGNVNEAVTLVTSAGGQVYFNCTMHSHL